MPRKRLVLCTTLLALCAGCTSLRHPATRPATPTCAFSKPHAKARVLAAAPAAPAPKTPIGAPAPSLAAAAPVTVKPLVRSSPPAPVILSFHKNPTSPLTFATRTTAAQQVLRLASHQEAPAPTLQVVSAPLSLVPVPRAHVVACRAVCETVPVKASDACPPVDHNAPCATVKPVAASAQNNTGTTRHAARPVGLTRTQWDCFVVGFLLGTVLFFGLRHPKVSRLVRYVTSRVTTVLHRGRALRHARADRSEGYAVCLACPPADSKRFRFVAQTAPGYHWPAYEKERQQLAEL